MRNLSFEDAYAQLQRVVSKMEEGAATLDEALKLYERGITLSQHCELLLEHAELRVKQLRDKEDGTLEEMPFDF
ncbi:MAG: exodeoxyribonuclease VII small subunit [Ardenticatenaceae bacterium]